MIPVKRAPLLAMIDLGMVGSAHSTSFGLMAHRTTYLLRHEAKHRLESLCYQGWQALRPAPPDLSFLPINRSFVFNYPQLTASSPCSTD